MRQLNLQSSVNFSIYICIFFLQGLNVEIAADIRLDFSTFDLAAEDVCIFAAFDLQGVFRSDLRRGVGQGVLLAVSLRLARV